MKHVLLNLHPLLANDAPTLAQKKRFLAAPDSQYSRQLLTALAQANLWPQRARELEQEFLVLEKTEYAPAPLLTGDHLVAKGYAPGPKFKQVLDKVYDEQLEGKIASHEQALQMATQLFSQG
jgi:poly(A) polymerase